MAERFNPQRQFKPEIPGYRGRIYYFGEEQTPIHLDEHKWQFESENGTREISILSIWNYQNHEKIAQAIIGGKRVAMYMWGTYGTGYLLNFPEWQKKDSDEAKDLREKLKIGRPINKSFPIMIHPDDKWMFWDFNDLHKSLQHLRNARARFDLYQSGPIHIIAPTKIRNPYLDESLKWPLDNTACYYYMPHPGWERVNGILRRKVKHAVFGGGSLNPHKKEPVYTTSGLHARIMETSQWIEGIDLIVVCELSEASEVFRSQTQIRLANKKSDGTSEIVRQGSTNPHRWSQEQGTRVKNAPEGVEEASSLWPYDEETNKRVDKKIIKGMQDMKKFDKEDAKVIPKIA